MRNVLLQRVPGISDCCRLCNILDIKKLDALDIPGKILFLKSKKVNYVISDTEWEALMPIKKIGKFYLYKLLPIMF